MCKKIGYKAIMLCAFISAVFGGVPVHADCGDIVITHPHLKATAPNAPVSAGYMVVQNQGSETKKLIAVRADFAAWSELHNMNHDHETGIMRMTKIEGGVTLQPQDKITFERGGRHLMFMQLHKQLKIGETYDISLIFAGGCEITMPFTVMPHNYNHAHSHTH